MGRSKKQRKTHYKSYYDKSLLNSECGVPESTTRYRNRLQTNNDPEDDAAAHIDQEQNTEVLDPTLAECQTGDDEQNDIQHQQTHTSDNDETLPADSDEEESFASSTSDSNDDAETQTESKSDSEASESNTEYNDFVNENNKRTACKQHWQAHGNNVTEGPPDSDGEEDESMTASDLTEEFVTETQDQAENSGDRSEIESEPGSGHELTSADDDLTSILSENVSDHDRDDASEYDGFVHENHETLWDNEEETNRSASLEADQEQQNINENHNGEETIPEDCIKGTEGFNKLLAKLNGTYSQAVDSKTILSPNDIIQMVLGLVQRHKWTHQEKEDVMKLINWILGKRVLPDTRFLMDSIFFPKSSLSYFFYCSQCTTMLGSNELLDSKTKMCPNTKCTYANVISDLNKATYFVCFDIPSQIALLFQDPDVRRKLLDPRNLLGKPHDGVLRDLYDGSVYRKFLTYLDKSSDTHYLSVSMSVDGVALFVSSSCSITPCFIMINELPPVMRMEKLILAGLWFGKKVQTDVFLPPIVDKIRHMSDTGFKIQVEDDVCWHIKLYLISLVADSGLRWDIQGIHSHRGEYCCSWCLHSGEELGNARKFPFSHPLPPLRTLQQLLEDATEALRTKKVIRGVKYLSVLSGAPGFHPIDGMVVDKMHAADEGVAKAFTSSWLGDEGVRPWSIKEKDHPKIEARINKARYPIEIRKALRKISHRARFTAREWENWTLFFSVPVLSGILKNNLLHHWSLFVQASHILLQTEITEETLNVANLLLLEFIGKIEILYGLEMMTFNVHLVSHFIHNTIRHGPQFALSAYAFEAGNQILKKIIFASNGIPHQVCRFISEGHAAQIMRVERPSDDAKLFLEKTKKNQALNKQVCNAELLGFSASFSNPNAQEKWLLNKHNINETECVVFHKVKVNGVTYETFHAQRRLDNSVALLHDEKVLQIKKILLNEVTSRIYVFGVRFRCRPSKYCPQSVVRLKKMSLCFLLDVLSVDENLICLPLSSLKSIFVNLKLPDGHSISPVPNIFNMF